MSHRYFPHTQEDVNYMLDCCGVRHIADLYSDVPRQLLFDKEYNLPSEKSEKEVRDFFNALGNKNKQLVCFAGNGFYDHYSPSVISSIIARSEFLTAYTPYQPEISQGTLQYIFEYQSMMCELTGLDVSNASMYDGTTATAEAVMMAVANARKKNRVLISATVNEAVLNVVKTYAGYHGIRIDVIPEKDGVTSKEDFEKMVGEGDVAGVVVAIRNRYGIIEDYTGYSDTCKSGKALLIMNCVALDLASVRTPGEWGADVAVGDGQSLGIPLSYGGPYIGFMTAKKSLMRKIPGRIVGATKDADGRRVFVLTLQAREQHIRREKATSNICSNQGLMSLYVTIYMSLMGAKGLKEVNSISAAGAHYLAAEIIKTGKAELAFPDKPYLNEFTLRTSAPASKIIEDALAKGILAGVALSENLLSVSVTEMQTLEQMAELVSIIEKA